jgi:hypothetical protein
VVTSMPYALNSRYGVLNTITMPPFTQFLGPYMSPSEPGTKYPTHIGRQDDWMAALIKELLQHHYFFQKFHPSITNWRAFYRAGYDASANYMYVLDDILDLEKVKRGFQENIRRDIKQAESQLLVRAADDVGSLLEICRRTYTRALPAEQ